MSQFILQNLGQTGLLFRLMRKPHHLGSQPAILQSVEEAGLTTRVDRDLATKIQ